MMQQLLNDK
jgi:hypothetical protein